MKTQLKIKSAFKSYNYFVRNLQGNDVVRLQIALLKDIKRIIKYENNNNNQ